MSLAADVLAGDRRAAVRLMNAVEGQVAAAQELGVLYRRGGKARVIGVTGGAGCGKSTLVDALIGANRACGRRVGVVAVDPSSPVSGGALLGDRIRMQRHSRDDGVMIRSLASKGHPGGLCRAAHGIVQVMDGMGFDPIIVETVGAGQGEVEIASASHLVVLVVTPDGGDGLQAIKAGIMEVANVICVNKADRAGGRDMASLLERAAAPGWRGEGVVPVIETVATTGSGIPDLHAEVWRQLDSVDADARDERQTRRVSRLVRDLLGHRLHREAARLTPSMDAQIQRVVRREIDPYTLVDGVVVELRGL